MAHRMESSVGLLDLKKYCGSKKKKTDKYVHGDSSLKRRERKMVHSQSNEKRAASIRKRKTRKGDGVKGLAGEGSFGVNL